MASVKSVWRKVKRGFGAVAALAPLVVLGVTVVQHTQPQPVDSVRNLDAQLAIAPDGSVDATYRLDWRFVEPERHGIKFSIATGEPLPDDPGTLRTFGVSDVTVTDGAGTPIPFTTAASDDLGRTSKTLTIGDPDKTVAGDMTYVVHWTGTGWLVDAQGRPAFAQDITSAGYPAIDRFSVAVTAPSDVTDPTCGRQVACQADAASHKATYSGGGVPAGSTLAVRGTLAEGAASVTPQRSTRTPPYSVPFSSHLTAAVGADGAAQVVEEATVLAGKQGALSYDVDTRRPLDEKNDRLMRVEGMSATWNGQPVTVEEASAGLASRTSAQTTRWKIQPPADAKGLATVRVAYRSVGAAYPRGDRAAIDVASGFHRSPGYPLRLDLTMPGAVLDASCLAATKDADGTPTPESGVHGATVTCVMPALADRQVLTTSAAASAVPGMDPTLEASLDGHEAEATRNAIVLGAVGVLAGFVLPLFGRVRPGRGDRFQGVPPGTIAPKGTPVAPDDGPEIPVRFAPPEASLAQAASVLRLKEPSRLLAAELAAMKVAGEIDLAPGRKLSITLLRRPDAAGLERSLADCLTPGSSTTEQVDAMIARATSAAEPSDNPSLWAGGDGSRGRRERALLFAVPVAAVVAGVLYLMRDSWGELRLLAVGVAVLVAISAGIKVARRPFKPALSARGTAVRDQTIGFKTYLSTAEAEQLRFEEGIDVFTAYLPWAILFDCARRWAKICRKAAEVGALGTVDTSSWDAYDRLASHDLSDDLGDIATPAVDNSRSWSSFGGGDGGDSGGSGGTSASSW